MSKMGHKIILEGCDGTGKTTLAEGIIESNPSMGYKLVHCTRHTPNNFEYFMNILKSEDNLILDRAFIGQFIYNSRAERKANGWLTDNELKEIERFINDNPGYFDMVYVTASDAAILYNCQKDGEDSYYTMDYIKDIKSRYKHFFMNSELEIVKEVFNEIPIPEVDKNEEDIDNHIRSFDYDSLPTIWAVDFDGTIASGAFPNIDNAIPNTELINELIEAKKDGIKLILWTNRTGSSLVDACNYCARFGLTFDAVNENIKEVRDNLYGGPRKVYADVYIDDKARKITHTFN